MTKPNTVEPIALDEIFVAWGGGEQLRSVQYVVAVEGVGLHNDRYALGTGTWSKWRDQTGLQVTLIESEMIDAIRRERGIDLSRGAHRRNLVTRGIDLQFMIGRKFQIGEALLEGIRPCLPCRHVERMTAEGARLALMDFGKGGLRANIIRGGTINVGDEIELLPSD